MNINIDERIYFFKEAIKSMERGVTPFCLERVSRQNKIKENYEQLLEWLEELKKLRKERNNNGWIPCKERLPETFEPKAKAYLTTNEDGMIGVSYYHHGWSNGYESVFDVIAWQPLPEPYREEQEDEQ